MMCDYEYNDQYIRTTAAQTGDSDICSKCRNGMMILVGILSGIVFAAAVVLLFINSLITAVFPAVLASLITGLSVLGIVLAAALFGREDHIGKKCIRCHIGGLFFGIIGTIISSLLAVSADLTVVSLVSGITLGLTAFFIAYLIVSVMFLVICAVKA